MKLREKIKSLNKYSAVICFLTLEVFALIGFSFTNNIILFGSLLLALVIVLLLFSLYEIKKNGMIRFGIIAIPLFVYILLTLVGQYSRAHTQLGDFSVAETVFAGIAMMSVCCCGFLINQYKEFKLSTFLTVIYSALALLVLLNLIINLVNFGPCYTILYKNYYMYYAGKRSSVPVNEMAYALEGFKFVEVKITHYTLYPIILLSSLLTLINLKWKEGRAKFIAYLAFAVLGVLALVFVPSWYGLIFGVLLLIIIGLIMLFKKTKINRKPFTIALYCLVGFAGLVLLIMIFNNQSFAGNFSSFIRNNAGLDRLFNSNYYARLYNPNVTDILCSERFFGFYSHQVAYFYEDLAHLTDSILFDNFMTSGVLGTAIIIAIFVLGFKGYSLKLKNEKSLSIEVLTSLSFVVIFLLFSLIAADGEYGIFFRIIKPTYMTAPFLITIFLLTYIYCSNPWEQKKNNIKEVVNNEI